MITAIDSSVVIDVLTGHPIHGQASAGALRRARQRGTILACPVVWAEVMAWYASDSQMRSDMDEAGIVYSPIGEAAAIEAGIAWRRYRDAGGPRARVIADFLIGAHAHSEADVLLTRDRGFHRRYFASLVIDDPSLTEA